MGVVELHIPPQVGAKWLTLASFRLTFTNKQADYQAKIVNRYVRTKPGYSKFNRRDSSIINGAPAGFTAGCYVIPPD